MARRGEVDAFHVGEERVNHQGIPMRLIAYRRWEDVDVLFLNGHNEVVRTEYWLFRDGSTKSYKSVIGMRLYGREQGVAGTIVDTVGHDKIVVRYDTGEECTIGRRYANPSCPLVPPLRRYDLSLLTAIPVMKGYYLDMEGNIYNSHGRRLRLKDSRGYKAICTWMDGKRVFFPIHRLMALTFLPRVAGKDQINHIDGDKSNNRLSNLEWVSAAENCQHRSRVLGKGRGERNARAVLTEEMVRAIVRMRQEGRTYKEIAARFNIYPSRITAIMMGDAWMHVTGFPCRRDMKRGQNMQG